ncbi:MAG: hypothetical protein K2Q09_04080 [Phycisphaerales bacterium]|nr:hypothetical protein [Phycisphaerales bacterium]
MKNTPWGIMVSLSCAAPALAQGFFDDFNSGALVGWSYYAPLEALGVQTSVAVSDGACRITSGISPNPAANGVPRVWVAAPGAANTPQDFLERADVLGFDGTNGQLGALAFRVGNMGTPSTRGYVLFIGVVDAGSNTAAFLFNRLSSAGQSATELGGYGVFQYTPGENLRLEVEGHGGTLTGRLYRLSQPDTPVATCSAFSTVYTSGASGLFASGRGAPAVMNSPLDVTFDNFSISPICGGADMGGQGGVAGADGRLDNNDFIAFIDRFFREDMRADLGGQGGLATPDGLLDNNDFIVFITAFFQGCS